MGLLCKCHGVSGSCSVKICWRTMPNFRDVGSALKSKFDGASQVKLSSRRNRLRPAEKHLKKPSKKDLVYLQDSPDYCNYDTKSGSLGTTGRQCNKTSYGLDGCTLMCCGRGYHTIVKDIEEDCNCTFFWCCRVECDKCRKKVEQNFCN
jgi:wingless-type MMTV integration site family protein 4